jgi:hypothetical protein
VIWTTRNGVIFDNVQNDINQWKRVFKSELGLFAPKTNPVDRQPSIFGETISCNFCNFFLWA